MASANEMGAIDVSPEMLALCGVGDVGKHRWPPRTVAFEFDAQLTVTFHERPARGVLNRNITDNRVVLLVDRNACERLLEGQLKFVDGASYLLPGELRAIAMAIRDCSMSAPSALPYRLAKSIELLCEILRADREGELVAAMAGSLSFADCRRVAGARCLIDDNWHEPLTLTQIARGCGLNRSKLSRGFRELYGCSVMEALAERRLAEAQRQLIATDLPIGLIGYRSGYQNNASFSRAFCRRFGLPPSDFRTRAAA